METIELPSASSKAKEDSSDDDNSVGTYVGIAVGGVAGILMLLVLARFAYRYFSKEQDDDECVQISFSFGLDSLATYNSVSIENWAAPIDHNRGGDSPNTPPAPHSPEDYYAGAGGMGRSRSDTSSLERDFSSPPMRERNFATYNEPSYQPAAPPPPPPPPPAMWSTAPPLASSAYASAGDESRYSQSSAGRRSSRGAATNISSNSNFAGVGSGFSNSGTPAPPVPPMPPMIKTTPPTNYEGSNRGSQVLVPRRSQLFDNTARAPTDALPSSEPTYSYKEDIEAIGSPRAYGSSHGPLGVANPEDRSRGG